MILVRVHYYRCDSSTCVSITIAAMLVILRQPLYILLMCLVWATVPIAFKLVTLGICLLLCIDASNSLGYCLVYNWVYLLLV